MAEPEDDAPGVPEWVVTYGDMMSLLLTFFIMLVSMSELKDDKGKSRAAMDAIRQVFGPTDGEFGAPGRSKQPSSSKGQRASEGRRGEGGTKRADRRSKGPSGPHDAVERLNSGTLATLGGPAQFKPFESALNDEMKKSLKLIANVIRKKPHQIVVRGHATPEPMPTNGEIASPAIGSAVSLLVPPWRNRLLTADGFEVYDVFDLSYTRSRAVAEFLISQQIPRERIILSAAGDTEQRVHTKDQSQQTLNRRVDVFLIDSYIVRPQTRK
ncbi:MAG: OmpA family protein [Planctomycetaceae bacterium]